ncbi:zinc-binding alcohol dehydrogenase family protein [Pedobacter cryoconitis]|uniref:NADPH:quinone reductase-like Zn-dependent oxidoreductase n=1 Tax=Pedobacter cryoconitis TaxID=188932 RepID=A0A7X0J197_9SPHI|nr:zinc-binding dehydrogenase [Pedobacter cryoconitis]MBB6499080.1 NADPH:quinone reductase-like Zn-dependent oxidoreductase [Pedobacter cryoconitis]
MKSILFNKAGEAADVLNITETDIAELLPGQVRVKVMASPINPSDYMFIKDQYRLKPLYPQIAGLEASGIITDVHVTVKGFKKGDHVTFRAVGTWAEFVNVNENELIPVEQDIPFEISCQIALNAITAHALLEWSKCKAGSYLLLSAASSALAGLIVQMAKANGIKTICLVRDMESAGLLYTQGAYKVLPADESDLMSRIMELTDHSGVDAFLDAVGGDILSKSLKVMRSNGMITLYGMFAKGPAEVFNSDVIYKNLTVTGFGIGQWLASKSTTEKRSAFSVIIDLIFKEKLILPQVYTYKLTDISKAVLFDQHKKTGKVVLVNYN